MYQNENDPNLTPDALKELYLKSCFKVLITDGADCNQAVIYVPLGDLERVIKYILLNEDNEVSILGYGKEH